MFLDINGIKDILVQRFPMLMVDRVLEFEKGERIKTLKNVSVNEIQFLGHFPDEPIMPGVLIIEAIAQSAAILFSLTNEENGNKKNKALFGSISKLRFLRPVLPGDQMIIEVEAIKIISFAGIVKAHVKVDGEIAAQGELTFGTSRKANNEKGNG